MLSGFRLGKMTGETPAAFNSSMEARFFSKVNSNFSFTIIITQLRRELLSKFRYSIVMYMISIIPFITSSSKERVLH